jgi:formate dehydrogenase subunit gamma
MSSNLHTVVAPNKMIRRFERSEIILHWVNAVPFLILILTGALNILSRFEIYSSPFIGAIRIIHRIAGVLWIGGIGYSFFFVGRELNIANTRDQFKMGLSDITWMIKTIRSMYNRHIEVPPVGKFNIGQKINAVLVILYAVAFAGSGALIWAFNTMLFPWYFHATVFFMTIFSLGGHLYLSFLHPSTRPGLIGIFNGMVPRSYVMHHHSLMIEGAANAHRKTAATGALISMKTERSVQKTGSIRLPDFDVLRTRDSQKSKYGHVERVSVVQSRSADARANSPHSFQRQQPQLDPDARLIATRHGNHSYSPEEIDMQKAWDQFGSIRLPQRST